FILTEPTGPGQVEPAIGEQKVVPCPLSPIRSELSPRALDLPHNPHGRNGPTPAGPDRRFLRAFPPPSAPALPIHSVKALILRPRTVAECPEEPMNLARWPVRTNRSEALMAIRVALCLGLCAVSVNSVPAADPAPPAVPRLTLRECIALAIQSQPAIRAQKA